MTSHIHDRIIVFTEIIGHSNRTTHMLKTSARAT